MDDRYTVSFNSDTSDSEDDVSNAGRVIIKAAMSVETAVITEHNSDIDTTKTGDLIENGQTNNKNHTAADSINECANGSDFTSIEYSVDGQGIDSMLTDTSPRFDTKIHITETQTIDASSEVVVSHVEEITHEEELVRNDDRASPSAVSDVTANVLGASVITDERCEYSSGTVAQTAKFNAPSDNNSELVADRERVEEAMSNFSLTTGVCADEGKAVLDKGVEGQYEPDAVAGADINRQIDGMACTSAGLPDALDTVPDMAPTSSDNREFSELNENTYNTGNNFEDSNKGFDYETYKYASRESAINNEEDEEGLNYTFRDKPDDRRPLTAAEQLIKRILAEAKAEQEGNTTTAIKFDSNFTRNTGGFRTVDDEEGEDDRREQPYSYLERRSTTEDHRGWDSPYDGSTRGLSPYSTTSEDHDASSMRKRYRHFGRYNNYTAGGEGGMRRSRIVPRFEESEGEELFDDSEFVPRRRAETEEVVRERTSDIRSMVDKQTNVLKKLKEASESFDELTNEIREIKKDFLENQYQRSLAFDDPDDNDNGYMATGAYYTVGGPSLEAPYTYQPPPAYQSRRQLELDPELQSETLTGGGSLRNLARNCSSPRSTSLGVSDYQMSSDGYVSLSSYKKNLENNNGDLRGKSYWAADNMNDFNDNGEITMNFRRPASSFSAVDDEEEEHVRPRYTSRSSYASSSLRYHPSYGQYSTKNTAAAAAACDGGTSRYASLSRSRTLPSSLSTERSDSLFSSRFLSKVREQRVSGEEPTKRDKPFKSRFLKKSFDSAYGSYPSSAATTPSPVSRYPTFSAARVTNTDMRNGGDTATEHVSTADTATD